MMQQQSRTGIEKKRKNRWDATSSAAISSGTSQQQVLAAVAERPPSAAASSAVTKHVVEPYVSDTEAMAALLAAASTASTSSVDKRSRGARDITSGTSTYQFKDRPSNWNTTVNPSIANISNTNNKRQRIPSHQQRQAPTYQWGTVEDEVSTAADSEKNPVVLEKEKPNFAVSGALATDASATSSRMYKGIQLKFQEPPEARVPAVTKWRLYVFSSSSTNPEIYHISKQSAYLFGREHSIADIPLSHPSCSKQHAVLQYRAVPTTTKTKSSKSKSTNILNKEVSTTTVIQCKPYLMDLESTNGTFINGQRIEDARYYELHKGDVLKFGDCSQEYVLMAE